MLERRRIECVDPLGRAKVGARLAHIKPSIEDERYRTDEAASGTVANPEVPQQLPVQSIQSDEVTVQGAADHHAFIKSDPAIRREQLGAGRRIFVRPTLSAR